jgi:hypothetical protein
LSKNRASTGAASILDICDAPRYLSSMFKGYSQAQMNETERKYWMDARARGKTRFIWRKTILTAPTGFLSRTERAIRDADCSRLESEGRILGLQGICLAV